MASRDNIRRKVKRFEEAAIELSWIGSRHPDDQSAIRDEYKKAKDELFKTIYGLIERQKSS